MTLLDSIFDLPDYEVPDDGSGVRARWPDLVVTARCSASSSGNRGFFEFAPLPGGFYLVGVGHERANSDEPCFVREQIMGQVTAGVDFGESVCNALRESDDCEVGYAQFDPARDGLELCGFGPSVSAVHVTAGVARFVHVGLDVACDKPQPFKLNPGEALVLVAHPGVWARHLLAALDHLVFRDLDGFDVSSALALCERLETMFVEAGLSSVVIYRSGSPAIDLWGFSQGPNDFPKVFEALDMELTPLDLELLDDLAGCPTR